MKIRNNTNDNDFQFGHGASDYITANAGVSLNIKTKLSEWKYNCFFALDTGIDWKLRLGYKGQRDLLDNEVKELLKSIPEVTAITKFETLFDSTTRKYTINFTIYTIYSQNPYIDSITLGG